MRDALTGQMVSEALERATCQEPDGSPTASRRRRAGAALGVCIGRQAWYRAEIAGTPSTDTGQGGR